ncbi:hypothetical protein FQA39_LY13739 [Lamprigera yunnana]|nr:hypothetical protein FQA39_LY13739 [Lamprigera yunnana]
MRSAILDYGMIKFWWIKVECFASIRRKLPRLVDVNRNKQLTAAELAAILENSDNGDEFLPDEDSDYRLSDACDCKQSDNENSSDSDDNNIQTVANVKNITNSTPAITTNINWVSGPPDLNNIPFTVNPGLCVPLPASGKPIEYFNLLVENKANKRKAVQKSAEATSSSYKLSLKENIQRKGKTGKAKKQGATKTSKANKKAAKKAMIRKWSISSNLNDSDVVIELNDDNDNGNMCASCDLFIFIPVECIVMLLGAMPDESAAALLLPNAKTRATDFSIAAIMARGAGSPQPCTRSSLMHSPSNDGQTHDDQLSRLSSPGLEDVLEDDDVEVDVEICSDGEPSPRPNKIKLLRESPPISECGSDAVDADRISPDIIIERRVSKTKILCNCEELVNIECHLETKDLWDKFHDLGTEMIITKSGRKLIFANVTGAVWEFKLFEI